MSDDTPKRRNWLDQAKRPPAPAGRRGRTVTPQTIASLCEALSYGVPIAHAARASGLREQTISRWGQSDPELAELLERARAAGVSERVRKLATDQDPKWAAWLLSRDPSTREHFRESMHGRSTPQITIAVCGTPRAGVVYDQPAKLPLAGADTAGSLDNARVLESGDAP